MTNDTIAAEPKGSARPHPVYSAMCILPDGKTITKAAAEAQGLVIQASTNHEPEKAPPRPLPAPLAAVPPVTVLPPIPAEVIAERARVLAIRVATPPGAEAEAAGAIRSGASVEEFRQALGAFTILSAMTASRGG